MEHLLGPRLIFPQAAGLIVKGNDSQGHWIPAEGQAVEGLLADLFSRGVRSEDIFLISPFRDVVRQLRQISSRFGGIKAGTIHTVQGKESDVVILVLGGHPDRPGAKKWASVRPNLLNVASSRAKRRLFVIGNKEAWSKYQYFSTCSLILSA